MIYFRANPKWVNITNSFFRVQTSIYEVDNYVKLQMSDTFVIFSPLFGGTFFTNGGAVDCPATPSYELKQYQIFKNNKFWGNQENRGFNMYFENFIGHLEISNNTFERNEIA